MKKLLALTTGLFFFTTIVFSQEAPAKKTEQTKTKSSQTVSKDKCDNKNCCMMKNGKMVMMKDGKEMPMDKEVTLENGTKIMKDGTMITKDGKKSKMKNDDCINMSGQDSKMHDMKMPEK